MTTESICSAHQEYRSDCPICNAGIGKIGNFEHGFIPHEKCTCTVHPEGIDFETCIIHRHSCGCCGTLALLAAEKDSKIKTLEIELERLMDIKYEPFRKQMDELEKRCKEVEDLRSENAVLKIESKENYEQGIKKGLLMAEVIATRYCFLEKKNELSSKFPAGDQMISIANCILVTIREKREAQP